MALPGDSHALTPLSGQQTRNLQVLNGEKTITLRDGSSYTGSTSLNLFRQGTLFCAFIYLFIHLSFFLFSPFSLFPFSLFPFSPFPLFPFPYIMYGTSLKLAILLLFSFSYSCSLSSE
jgi:hypothetical protein